MMESPSCACNGDASREATMLIYGLKGVNREIPAHEPEAACQAAWRPLVTRLCDSRVCIAAVEIETTLIYAAGRLPSSTPIQSSSDADPVLSAMARSEAAECFLAACAACSPARKRMRNRAAWPRCSQGQEVQRPPAPQMVRKRSGRRSRPGR
jgi:hypothetical protein